LLGGDSPSALGDGYVSNAGYGDIVTVIIIIQISGF